MIQGDRIDRLIEIVFSIVALTIGGAILVITFYFG